MEPRSGEMKLHTGSLRPVVVRIVEWNSWYFPIEIIARYVAICRRCDQCQVVRPAPARRLTRSPLPATLYAEGAVTRTENVALSRGVLLFGNHVAAPTG